MEIENFDDLPILQVSLTRGHFRADTFQTNKGDKIDRETGQRSRT